MAANEASGGNQAVSRCSCRDGHHRTLKDSFETIVHAVYTLIRRKQRQSWRRRARKIFHRRVSIPGLVVYQRFDWLLQAFYENADVVFSSQGRSNGAAPEQINPGTPTKNLIYF